MPDTVPVSVYRVVVLPQMAADMRLAAREAVNVIAEAITKDARRELRGYIGQEQRLSGQSVTSTWKQGATGRQRGSADPRGIKINPYYLVADSVTKPVAICAVRGPAQRTEHPRRGGYEIRPTRKASTALAIPLLELFERTSGLSPASQGRAIRAAAKTVPPALAMPDGQYRYSVKGGAHTPPAPITKAFARGPATARRLAQASVEKHFRLRTGIIRYR